jgi:hypothetical protein
VQRIEDGERFVADFARVHFGLPGLAVRLDQRGLEDHRELLL